MPGIIPQPFCGMTEKKRACVSGSMCEVTVDLILSRRASAQETVQMKGVRCSGNGGAWEMVCVRRLPEPCVTVGGLGGQTG